MAPSSTNRGRRRVVLRPLPYQGHINPMLRLAAALHSRGLAVTILHPETRAPDRRKLPADYRLVTIPDNIPPELAASEDIASFVFELNKNCAAPFRDYLTGALREEEGEDGRLAFVVADVDWFAPLSVARELGLAALALMTSSAARFLVYMAYPSLCRKGYLPVQELSETARHLQLRRRLRQRSPLSRRSPLSAAAAAMVKVRGGGAVRGARGQVEKEPPDSASNRRKLPSQPIVVKQCWPTKRARVSGSRRQTSQCMQQFGAANDGIEAVHTVETEAVHTVETETEAVHTIETEVVHTVEAETEVLHTVEIVETEADIEFHEAIASSPVKKTKMISELVCAVQPKTRNAKAKKGTRRGRKR